jgi:hypothetical protein
MFSSGRRIQRVDYVSEVVGRPAAQSPASVPREAWRPRLIVPGHHNESFEWLDQTRQMFDRGEWRVRRVDYENAPVGHAVYAASPYRWWLGFVAWWHHAIFGGPIDRSVERAAYVADPLLLLLLGTGTTIFVGRRFGLLPAALLSAGLVTLFPFASSFLPAAPDDHGLAQACALWSVLALLVAFEGYGSEGKDAGSRIRRWFFAAGALGGVGLWINVSLLAPVIAGVALGALVGAWVVRREARRSPAIARESLPWRAWGLGGALTCLLAYCLEFFPSQMGAWELRAIHPVFGLAWLGAGEALARLTGWIQGGRPWRGFRDTGALLLALVAVASVPVAMWRTHSAGFLAVDLATMRLSLLPGGVSAPSFRAWLMQGGFTSALWATVLPVLVVVPAVWVLKAGSFAFRRRLALAVAIGPVVAVAGFAFWQISWWNGLDSSLLALAVASAAAVKGAPKRLPVAWVSGVFLAFVVLPGAWQIWPEAPLRIKGELTRGEVVGLIERDLAGWLADHAGTTGAIALAPPDATTALYYYGGIRGLGTLGWENRDGLTSAIRIVSASTPEEALDLIGQRGVTHILMPRWDPYMDVYARLGEGQVEGTFLERLRQWRLPPQLRPVPYLIPTISGFEGQSVVVLEVVEEQDAATEISRLAEYFAEMGQQDLAARASQTLKRFPADPGAILARAEVALAGGDADEFARTVEILMRRMSGRLERALPWDQRVSLAIVLAQAHRIDLARARLRQCLDEVDEAKLRSLSTDTLYRMQVLRRALRLEIVDPRLRAAALNLLPPDLRSRLQR